MTGLRYTEEHEWFRRDADGLVTVGITAHAQQALGDIVYVQVPEPRRYAAGEEAAVVESVKAAGGIRMPFAGEVTHANPALEDAPGLVNESPQDRGWFFAFRPEDPAAFDALLDEDAYDRLLKAQADH